MGAHLNREARGWYDHLPAVTTDIACDGVSHRITWRHGRLILEDHDPLAERSLAALGGKPPMCLELLDAWGASRGSELISELLLEKGTISADELGRRRARHETEVESARGMLQRMLAHMGNQRDRAEKMRLVERQAVERLEREEREWATTLTDVFPPRFRKVLALSMIVNVERNWHDEGFRRNHARHVEPALATLATPMVERSASRWSRNLKPYRGFTAKTVVAAPGEQPTCTVWADRTLVHATLSLPLSWFTDLWARGLALVDGCFVMAVDDSSADGAELRVQAVRFEYRDWKTVSSLEAPAIVRRRGAGWQLNWM